MLHKLVEELWKFLLSEEYSSSSIHISKVNLFISYFDKYFHFTDEFFLTVLRNDPIFVEIEHLKEFLDEKSYDFIEEITRNATVTIACLRIAYAQVFCRLLAAKDSSSILSNINSNEISPKFIVRIIGCSQFNVSFDQLKSAIVGRFVTLEGSISRQTITRPFPQKLLFNCAKCFYKQEMMIYNGIMQFPTKCISSMCKSKVFIPLPHNSACILTKKQTIKLQQTNQETAAFSKSESDSFDEFLTESGGRIPKTFDVELSDDLVDSVKPGDVVFINGIVRASINSCIENGKAAKGTALLSLYLEAHSFNASVDKISLIKAEINLCTQVEEQSFRTLCQHPDFFYYLAHSISPMIYGHEMVKAGMLLTLLTGSAECKSFGSSNSATNIPCEVPFNSSRQNSHILLVGDPGIGKSQMLCAISKLSPRSVYVCGNTASNAGLTVSLVHDGSTGDFALEAGALVLADRGICCIDEFDKMQEYRSLLEAMEQQSISIAKAGIVCTLPCRASIIAAANPIHGHFNEHKSLTENIKLDPAILSRFDLIFLLIDKPDSQLDSTLSNHIMRLHSNSLLSPKRINTISTPVQTSTAKLPSLISKLVSVDKNSIPSALTDISFLQKVITFAKAHIHPVLSFESSNLLKEFYLDLRKNYTPLKSFPITPRTLEAAIRLSKARARIELSSIVTVQHATEVIELMLFCFSSCNFTSTTGNSTKRQSKSANIRNFMSALESISDKTEFSSNELKDIASQNCISIGNWNEFIHILNINGFIVKTLNGLYKRT